MQGEFNEISLAAACSRADGFILAMPQRRQQLQRAPVGTVTCCEKRNSQGPCSLTCIETHALAETELDEKEHNLNLIACWDVYSLYMHLRREDRRALIGAHLAVA